MRTKTIQIPLYYERLRIVVTKKLDKPEYAAYVEFKRRGPVLHITPKATAGIIAHEAVHIVNYVFKQADIQLDIENDEPYAYLLGWVVEQITKAVHAP